PTSLTIPAYSNTLLHQDVAAVEPLIHVNDSDPCLQIPSCDGSLDRCGAAPARQKRCVQIQAGNLRNFQNVTGQDLPVRHDDNYIGLKRANISDGSFICTS